MTPAEAEALGRRWIAAGGGWREGMLSQHGERVLSLAPPTEHPRLDIADPCPESRPPWDILTVRTDDGGPRVPDLRDPATRGAALEVVRERWGVSRLWVEFQVDNTMWSVGDWVLGWACLDGEKPPPDIMGDSEEEVLVMALEAAPPPP